MKFYEKWLAFAAISVFFSGFGSAQAQESEESTEPAFVANFSNLPEAKRTEYLKHRSKAYEYSTQKRTFESLGEIHKATEIFDEDPSLWSLKASCYVEFRIFDKAKKAYERSLALRPKDMGTLFNLAEMDFISRDWEGAIKKMTTVKEAVEDASESVDAGPLSVHRLCLFKIVISHLKLGQKDEAKKIASEYWNEFDDSPFTYFSKAVLAYEEDNDEEAKEWLASASRVFRDRAVITRWQDSLIEVGYFKSLYHQSEEEN